MVQIVDTGHRGEVTGVQAPETSSAVPATDWVTGEKHENQGG